MICHIFSGFLFFVITAPEPIICYNRIPGNYTLVNYYFILPNKDVNRYSLVEYCNFYPTPLHTKKLGDLHVMEVTLPCYAKITQEEQD